MGRLAPGLLANIVIYDGQGRWNPYRAANTAGPEDIVLVLQGDRMQNLVGLPTQTHALYGDLDLMAAMVGSPIVDGCEPYVEPAAGIYDVCGVEKFICTNRLEAQTYAGEYSQFWLHYCPQELLEEFLE